MTEQQKKSINDLYVGFLKNKEDYLGWGSYSVCNFVTYKNDTEESDDNIVVNIITISGISDNNQVFTTSKNILVEASGMVYVLEDLFSTSKVITYLQKLKSFNWNG